MKLLIRIAFLVIPFVVNAQSRIKLAKPYESIKVGDKMPMDFEMKMFNYKTGKSGVAKLSDYKGKIILLDMWANSCLACIKAFPHLEELQKKFGDKIQILLVNSSDSLSQIKSFLKRREKNTGNSLELPIVYNDSAIGWQLFKHQIIPHVAWINTQGNVMSITGGQEVNESHINDLLNGNKVSMVQKDDFLSDIINYDASKPYFIGGNSGDGEGVVWYSTLSKRVPGMVGTGGVITDSNVSRINCNNWPLEKIYRLAFSDVPNVWDSNIFSNTLLPPNRFLLEVKDTSKFVEVLNESEAPDNLWVYQLIGPKGTNYKRLLSKMQTDLDMFFNYSAQMEKRNMKCLVLTCDDTTLIRYREGKMLSFVNDYEIRVNNITTGYLRFYLDYATEYVFGHYPLIDETGYKGKLGLIEIEGDISDPVFLNKALEKYKMHFRLEDREVNVLVIRDR